MDFRPLSCQLKQPASTGAVMLYRTLSNAGMSTAADLDEVFASTAASPLLCWPSSNVQAGMRSQQTRQQLDSARPDSICKIKQNKQLYAAAGITSHCVIAPMPMSTGSSLSWRNISAAAASLSQA